MLCVFYKVPYNYIQNAHKNAKPLYIYLLNLLTFTFLPRTYAEITLYVHCTYNVHTCTHDVKKHKYNSKTTYRNNKAVVFNAQRLRFADKITF